MTDRIAPETLRTLAIDAFEVMNWARREGMKKERQLEETVKAFEITLGYREPVPAEVKQ